MTERAAASALILAWNLRKSDSTYGPLFGNHRKPGTSREDDEEKGYPQDELADISVFQLRNGSSDAPKFDFEVSDERELARAVAFYAASTLKLFTKRHESWWCAEDHVRNNYGKFTSVDFPILMTTYEKASVEKLHRYFQTRSIFKGTLGKILLATEKCPIDTDMTQELYGKHLAYTGLHAIPLFIRARTALGAETDSLVAALEVKRIKSALEQLDYIINNYLSVDKPQNALTWQYARIFDDTAFAHLATKNCKTLVCILAHLCDFCGVAGPGNILEIAVLEQMSAEQKSYLKATARNIYKHFTVSSAA